MFWVGGFVRGSVLVGIVVGYWLLLVEVWRYDGGFHLGLVLRVDAVVV